MIRFYMLPRAMSDVSFSPIRTSPPVFSQSWIFMRPGRLSSPLAHPPLTLHCLPNAIKGPDEVGVEGRSLDNSLLLNLAIDKLLSASSPATLTGLASVPELVGANTADLPNKGENPLECTLCDCLFLDLRLDSVGLPLSHTQWFNSLLSGNVLNIFIERCYLCTPPLACTAALYDQGCYWHLLCASFSFGDPRPSLS